jgi:ABC-type polysaccharide/polyol phosphate transport system ATPase subunit
MTSPLLDFPSIKATDMTVRFPLRDGGLSGLLNRRTHTALDSVSFEVKPGARIGLLGRNGSGKSTLLRTLAGVYSPQLGTMEVHGRVAAIFNASLGFYQVATGYENIFLRGAMLGLSFEKIRDMADEIIEFAELEEWIHQPISSYSSGMALRLAFAITTSIQSDILLLDEWLGAGDAQFMAKAQARMSRLVENASIVVFATHNIRLMREQCTEALVIDDGKLCFNGEIDAAIAHYQQLRPVLGA